MSTNATSTSSTVSFWSRLKGWLANAASDLGVIVGDVVAAAPTVEAVTAAFSPQVAAMEKVGVAILQEVENVVNQASTAAGGAAPVGPVTVTLSTELVADFHAALGGIKSVAQLLGVTPAAAPAAAPKTS